MRYVIALGGNALSNSSMRNAASEIAKLSQNNQIIITHGNGLQVGQLSSVEEKSLAVLTAQTQAEIGLGIENSIANAFLEHPHLKKRRTAVVITRVLVDPKDIEFKHPSKPIGKFYTKTEAGALAKKGLKMAKLIGGYRRIVPSPAPLEIEEKEMIHNLLSLGYIVICAGGGGIPVTKSSKGIEYLNGVIDKDYASALLAKETTADLFLILTRVKGVYLNFGTNKKRQIKCTTTKELKRYMKKEKFESGSIFPKIKSTIDFVESTKRKAIIGSMSSSFDKLGSEATVITS